MAFTPADYLDLLHRTTDAGWLEPLLEEANSYAILGALTKQAARVSLAGERNCEAGQIMLAPSGRVGVSTLHMAWPGSGVATLPQGTIFEDARRLKYVLPQDILLPTGAAPKLFDITVESLRKIELVNTVDDPDMRFSPVFIIADATNATPISISTTTVHTYITGAVVKIVGVEGNTAANGFWPITVVDNFTFLLTGSVGNGNFRGVSGYVQPAPVSCEVLSAEPVFGGNSDWLTVLGRERGIKRQSGEQDASFRARVRNIPDVVTPIGLLEAANGVAQFYGLPTFQLLEPFEDSSTALLDESLGLGAIDSLYYNNSPAGVGSTALPRPFAWDETVSLLQARREGCAYFQMRPTAVPAYLSLSVAFWDVMFYDDPVAAFFDTDAASFDAGFAAVYEELFRKRAACVSFDIVIPVDTIKYYQGSVSVPGSGEIVAWTATPPTGKAWWLWYVWAGRVAVPAAPHIDAAYHRFRFTFDDATIYDSPPIYARGTSRITAADLIAILGSKRISQIEGILGDNGDTLKLVGAIRVVEVQD